MREQFFFGVPLRASATAQRWDRVCALLQMCSAINETDGDFRVLLACHNAPDFVEMSDPRIQVIRSEAPIPTTSAEQMHDKGRKLRAIRAAMRQHGGGYLMALDADDLVSNKLVGFVRRDHYPYGYLIDEGYEYDCSADACALRRVSTKSAAVRRFSISRRRTCRKLPTIRALSVINLQTTGSGLLRRPSSADRFVNCHSAAQCTSSTVAKTTLR